MTCLTVTPATAAEAIREQAALIVSHHPVLFRAAKRIRADLAETGHLWSLARAGIAIASPHTAFDNTRDGINDLLCRVLGITDATPLRPSTSGREPASGVAAGKLFKVVVFTPVGPRGGDLGRVRGRRRASSAPTGSARSPPPATGRSSAPRHRTRQWASVVVARRFRELRVELVCPADRLPDVLAAIRARHSYEEPAIDVYPLQESRPAADRAGRAGAGRLGRLDPPRGLADFAFDVGRALASACVQFVGDADRPILRWRWPAARATTSSRMPPGPGPTCSSPARRDSIAASKPRRWASP